MAYIEKRIGKKGKVSYKAQIRRKGYGTLTKSFMKKTDADEWIAKQENAIYEREKFPNREARKKTFADAVDRFIESGIKTKKGRIRADSEKVKTHLEWWKKHLGASVIMDIDHQQIRELALKLQNESTPRGERRSGATVNRYIASLSVCFSYAIKNERWGIRENPVKYIDRFSEADEDPETEEGETRLKVLTAEERNKLLEAARDDAAADKIYPIVLLAISTGMRCSEITHLRWPAINLKTGWIILNKTKNKTRRSVPLSGPALEELKRLGKIRKLKTDYVFTQEDGVTPFNIRKSWVRIRDKTGLVGFRFHDLRHTAASYLAESGASLIEIADILGHKTMAMVQRYTHLTDKYKAKVVERMNEAIFGGVENG